MRTDATRSTSRYLLARLGLLAVSLLLLAACAEDTEPEGAVAEETEVVTEVVTETVTEVVTDGAGQTEGTDAVLPTEGPDDEPAALQGDVFSNPDEYTGQDVQVDAQVVQVLSDQAFTIAAPDWGGKVLHVTIDAGVPVPQDGPATVTGTVRIWDEGSIEDELGVELDDDVAADFDGEAYIEASDISAATGDGATEAAGATESP